MPQVDVHVEGLKCKSMMSVWMEKLMNGSVSEGLYECAPHFDGSFCWHGAMPGATQELGCPWSICADCSLPDAYNRTVVAQCGEAKNVTTPFGEVVTGQYLTKRIMYDQCTDLFRNYTYCISYECHSCTDWYKGAITDLTLYLSVASLVCLIISVVIFASFRSLRCMRSNIHIHLCIAFSIRFAFYIPWITLTSKTYLFYGCLSSHVDEEFKQTIEPVCQTTLFMIMYGTVSSTYWMLVEGCFLASRLSTFGMHSEGSLSLFMAVGYGVPLIISLIWVGVIEFQSTEHCWMDYPNHSITSKFFSATVIFSLVVNFVVLLGVLVVLIKKLWAHNVHEDKKLWKTIKATLFLVPLLGIPNLLLLYSPEKTESSSYKTYMFFTSILQHSQGVSIAFVYCFLNAEVIATIKRFIKTTFPTSTTRTTRKTSVNRFTARNNSVKVEAKQRNAGPDAGVTSEPLMTSHRNMENFEELKFADGE